MTTGTSVGSGAAPGAMATIRRGLSLSPEITQGFAVTLFFGIIATAGRVVVPIAVQQTIDRGLNAPGGPDIPFVRTMVILAAIGIVVTVAAAYQMNVRLFRASETGLATLRIRAFRHVHDLS